MIQDTESKAKRILVVDDDKVNRLVLQAILEEEGYRVTQASSGESALEIVFRGDTDLILLDIIMPGIDGFDTCRRIREELNLLTLPIILITSLEDRDSRIRGKAVGADDFLNKPVDHVELVVRVSNLLRVKAYHDLRESQQQLLEQELEQTRAQLLRADRLATLGTLAAGVGHELSNLSQVMTGALGLITKDIKQGNPPKQKYLEDLEAVFRHVQSHARQLLELGRPGNDHEELVDLRDVVGETLSILQLIGKTKCVGVQAQLPEEAVPVTVNRTRIEQIFINLMGNAADAIMEKSDWTGTIQVTVESPQINGRVKCTIEDNGPGIPKEIIEKIFAPYYTTKPSGKGTGLGLSVVRNIIESYGGTLALDSRPGERTVFSFDLPVAPKQG